MCFAYCMRLVKGTLLITTKKILIILRLIYKGHGYNYVDFRERERKTESQAVLIGKTPHEHAVTPEDRAWAANINILVFTDCKKAIDFKRT